MLAAHLQNMAGYLDEGNNARSLEHFAQWILTNVLDAKCFIDKRLLKVVAPVFYRAKVTRSDRAWLKRRNMG